MSTIYEHQRAHINDVMGLSSNDVIQKYFLVKLSLPNYFFPNRYRSIQPFPLRNEQVKTQTPILLPIIQPQQLSPTSQNTSPPPTKKEKKKQKKENMPRSMAPPPSGEFSITLTKSFSLSDPSAEKISIIGEPNRPATISIASRTGAQNQTLLAKEGALQADDVNELLDLVKPLGGFPSKAGEDVYGLGVRLVLSTFEVQWDNGEEGGGVMTVGAGAEEEGPTEENKQSFKEVVESIEALARQKAKSRTS
ncbi:MAG: hypothetical protein Q9177_004481 [Variospora cf. flavescens]